MLNLKALAQLVLHCIACMQCIIDAFNLCISSFAFWPVNQKDRSRTTGFGLLVNSLKVFKNSKKVT